MFVKISLIAVFLVATATIVLGQRKDGDCIAPAGSISYCSQYIYSNCKNATFIADRAAYGENCSRTEVSLFWDAPVYNMTISFESDTRGPYTLCMQPVGCSTAYRTLEDGREVAIDWNTFKREPVCFESKEGNQPTMKFRFDAGSQWHCYGTFIRFFYRL